MSGISKRESLTVEEKADILDIFTEFDRQNIGFVEISDLKEVLENLGFKLPGYKLREMYAALARRPVYEKKKIELPELEVMYYDLKTKQVASTFRNAICKNDNVETRGGILSLSSEGATHSVRYEEQFAFSDWINSNLASDPDLKHLLPIDTQGKSLFAAIKDGLLLCKVINHFFPDTIDERTINKLNLSGDHELENLTLALNSSQSIGCSVANIDAHHLAQGKPHLVLGLLWQIIRFGLFRRINIENCPALAGLLDSDEHIEDLIKMFPEETIFRWVNYHLECDGIGRRCTNFSKDIVDSEIYSYLLYRIGEKDADVNLDALDESDLTARAELMLQQAAKLDCRSFLTPQDVVNGVEKLNFAFLANLLSKHPGLVGNFDNLPKIVAKREEKTYRNWMNSVGVVPPVNWLYSDLTDGLIIFRLIELMKPGTVDWSRVHQNFIPLRKFMEMRENCNYALQLGRQLKLSLVGIAGHDICDGNPALTLALIWQLMRLYTLSFLPSNAATGRPIIEREIVAWVNTKLTNAGKSPRLKSFNDAAIADGKIVIDLIDVITEGRIDYGLVKDDGSNEANISNAKYAISMARKMGARTYALPEDIIEVKPKMMMTLFACLMAACFKNDEAKKQIQKKAIEKI